MRNRERKQCRRAKLLGLLRRQHVFERCQRYVGKEFGGGARLCWYFARLQVALDRRDGARGGLDLAREQWTR